MSDAYNPYAGQTLSPYEPTWRDRLASMMLGEQPSFEKRRSIEGLLGSSGLGDTGMSLVDFTGLGGLLDAQTQAAAGDYRSAAMAMVPGMKQAKAAVKPLEKISGTIMQEIPRHFDKPGRKEAWEAIPSYADQIKQRLESELNVPVKISASDTNFGRSWYVRPDLPLKDENPFVVRISDHNANPRMTQVEARVNVLGSGPGVKVGAEPMNSPEQIDMQIQKAIEFAKKYAERNR